MDRPLRAFGFLLILAIPCSAPAAKVTLKNGTVLEGELYRVEGLTDLQGRRQAGELKTTPFLRVETGHKRYFLHDRQRLEIDPAENLLRFDIFELPQTRSPKTIALASVGLPLQVTGFDENGRRIVTLQTTGKPLPIVQGVTRISPDFVTVEGVNHNWWQGIATRALPPEQLAAMLHKAIDEKNPDDRMAVARFYIEAGLYEPAAVELERIAQDFPAFGAKVEELDTELRQLRARSLLAEVRRRQAAGQHRLAMLAAESFPTELGFEAEVLRQVEALKDWYRKAQEKGDGALLELGELESKLENDEQRAAVATLRPVLREQLDWESLSRLDAFFQLADDLSAAERLALAYSGWVTGSGNATTDLPKALALWRARSLAGEYLRTEDPGRRSELLAQIGALEGIGPEAVGDLVPLLPPWVESSSLPSVQVHFLETIEMVPGWGGERDGDERKALIANAAGPVRYAVVLPPEYAPTRSYPLLVALRPAEWRIEQAAEFWGVGHEPGGQAAPGPAARAGYIVIAPEYAPPKQVDYGYTARENLAVRAAIRDAKKRFAIDSDRVFLAGHGMGADASFDIATAHPDLFAGVVSISGLIGETVKFNKENAGLVPFYVINGFLDRGAREVNADDLAWMMKHGQDVLYCEFIGRGYEYYQEELPNVLDWMGRLRRAPDPKEIEVSVLRPGDDRYYWVTAEGIPQNLLVAAGAQGRATPRPMTLKAKVTPGNTISLSSAARGYALRLNGELIDLEQRVRVTSGGRQLFNDFVAPDIAALLDDLAENGDRQRRYPVRIVVP